MQALRSAARDGVDVRLLVPGASDIWALRGLSRAGYRPLLEAGVRVYEQRSAVNVRRGERDHRVDQHQEIRPAAGAIDRVGGVRVHAVEMRARRGRQMSAGREAHDADAVRQHAIFAGLLAHDADGALRVVELGRMAIFRPQPVLQNKGRDPHGVQPARNLVTLFVHREVHIAASRAHDHGRSGASSLRHEVCRQSGLVLLLGPLCSGSAVGVGVSEPICAARAASCASSARNASSAARNTAS